MKDSLPPDQKLASLDSLLRGYAGGLLAFSGGVDSSFLLKAMLMADMRVLAVTAVSETMPRQDREDAVSFARALGADHLVIHTSELQNEAFARNAPDRCFHCKDELFGRLKAIAAERNMPAVFDGSNHDDLADYRPGRRAAEGHGIISPLAECGMTKEDIRLLSRQLGLKTWDRPSSPCLSSRFPYGTRITSGALARVGRAEDLMRGLGIRVLRVRDDGGTARIEVEEKDMPLLLAAENRRLIIEGLRALGYRFVALDLEGYRSGSLNRMLQDGKS